MLKIRIFFSVNRLAFYAEGFAIPQDPKPEQDETLASGYVGKLAHSRDTGFSVISFFNASWRSLSLAAVPSALAKILGQLIE
ncbi:hypothetical protein JTB14_015823 [Gonioctena quinquepunctata]|nr:hypothetical protein JTB14_015823 [Gonioctena quinquepunctata]